MKSISTIIFDLDGTIVDSSQDITAAINHVRKHFSLKPLTVQEVVDCVGLGVAHLMEKAVLDDIKADPDEVQLMIVDYYTNHLVDQTATYLGIDSLVKTLVKDYSLAIATNKPISLAEGTINRLGLEKIFKIVAGPETAGAGKPNPAMLEYIADKFESTPGEVLMVGDSKIDIVTAQNFGCRACAVTWGYNSRDALEELNPNFMIDKPMDLLNYL